MTHPAITPKDIAKAKVGTITTPVLRQVSRHANALKTGDAITDESAILLIMCIGPLLEELIEHREQCEAVLTMPAPDATNVVQLRGDVQ